MIIIYLYRVLWESFYADKENVNSFQRLLFIIYYINLLFNNYFLSFYSISLTQLEGDLCCGFYAPMGCITNNASFPEEFRLGKYYLCLQY